MLARNLRVGRGEIDLLIGLAGERVAVEVKTSVASSVGDPIYHFDDAKQHQVRALAQQQGVYRVDYVGVELSAQGATVRWLPNIC